jgi:hypothetical protein
VVVGAVDPEQLAMVIDEMAIPPLTDPGHGTAEQLLLS